MQFLRTTILALTFMVLVQPVFATVISDGSAGVFRPTTDFTLDLSSLAASQYSSIYIDAGITLTILTPTGGAFADLLAANDIFINGIVDAGAGNLGLLAGNHVALGLGSQIIANSLNIVAATISSAGEILMPPVGDRSGSGLIGGDITLSPGGDVTLSENPSNTGAGSREGGTLIVGSGGSLTNLGGGDGGGVTIHAVPEPSVILLLLPGLIFFARHARSRAQ